MDFKFGISVQFYCYQEFKMNVGSKFSEVTTKLTIKERQNTAIWRKMTKNSIFTKKKPSALFLKNIKEQIRQGRLFFFVSFSPVKLKISHKHQKNLKKY